MLREPARTRLRIYDEPGFSLKRASDFELETSAAFESVRGLEIRGETSLLADSALGEFSRRHGIDLAHL